MNSKTFLTGLMFCGVLFIPRAGLAEGIHISSSAIFLHAEHGDKIYDTFSVFADTDNPHELTFKVKQKTWFLLDENKDISLHSWLRVIPKDVVLQPGEELVMKYRITVPHDAQGYLMGMITFEMLPFVPEEEEAGEIEEDEKEENETEKEADESEQQEIQAEDDQKIKDGELEEEEEKRMVYSLPLYLLIKGTVKTVCNVSTVTLVQQEKRLSALVEIENAGNVFLRPEEISLTIYDADGYEAGAVFLETGWPIFPNLKQVFRGESQNLSLDPGEYILSILIEGEYPDIEYAENRRLIVTDTTYEIIAEKEEEVIE